jgi:hypothetical protein
MQTTLETALLVQYLLDLTVSILALSASFRYFKIKAGLKGLAALSLSVSTLRVLPYIIWPVGKVATFALLLFFTVIGFLTVLVTIYRFYHTEMRAALGISLVLFIALTTAGYLATTLLAGIFYAPVERGQQSLIKFDSDSMVHEGTEWKRWLTDRGITEESISSFPLQNGIKKDEYLTVIKAENVSLGDVILYDAGNRQSGNPLIMHRVVGIVMVEEWAVVSVSGTLDCLTTEDYNTNIIPRMKDCYEGNKSCIYEYVTGKPSFRFYMTKGDNNRVSDQCAGILPVIDEQITGKAE